MNPFSIAILAGGKSSRMGQNKALLDIGGKSILQIMLERLASLECEIFLIANESAPYQRFMLPIFPDSLPKQASLVGIYSALQHSKTEYCFVLACDMPFIQPKLLSHIVAAVDSNSQAIVPRFQGQAQPLHSLYQKSCLKSLEAALDQNQFKIRQFLASIKSQYIDDYQTIDPKGLSFSNINTPEDYQRCIEALRDEAK